MTAYALARAGDLFTSHAAAASVNVSAAEAVVLDALRAHPAGLTSHELAEVTGRALVSVSPRMRPLCEKGKVCEAGRRDNRTVWRVMP